MQSPGSLNLAGKEEVPSLTHPPHTLLPPRAGERAPPPPALSLGLQDSLRILPLQLRKLVLQIHLKHVSW